MSEEMKDELTPQEQATPVEEVEQKVEEKQESAVVQEETEVVEEHSEEEVKKEETEPQPCAKCGKVECECDKEKEEEKVEEEKEVDSEKEEKKEEGESETEEEVEQLTEPERDQIREDLIAELEELKAEKEEREALEVCNKEVMKVEQEFTTCTERIAQALKDSFAQNNIDATKTLEELRKEDPAKATLAEQFIRQATELKTQLETAAMNEIAKHQNDVIYKAASREFEKLGLNLEQAKEAVRTFKRIVNEVGIADLKEDLQMKVQLAAGRAKILHPTVEQTSESEIIDTTTLEEPNPEKELVDEKVSEEAKKEVPPTPVVEKLSEPVVQKPKVSDFEEGVLGNSSANAGTLINELNVLEELAKLPYKERARFYKEHEDVITKALSKRG